MVTQAQVKSGYPISAALDSLAAALAALNAANGNNSLLRLSVVIGDGNLNQTGQVDVTASLPPSAAAPFFQTMIAQLTALQTALNSQLAAI